MFFCSRDYFMSSGFLLVDSPVTDITIKRVNEVCKEKSIPLAKLLYPPFKESL